MIALRDIRYVRLGCRDIDASVAFATRILGLELAGRDRHGAYFRSDQRDHTLVYLDAPPEEHAIGFEVPGTTVDNTNTVAIAVHRMSAPRDMNPFISNPP